MELVPDRNLLPCLQGKTPPGIRNDIKDTPPFSGMQPKPSQVARRRKPWETSQAPNGGLQSALEQAAAAEPQAALRQHQDQGPPAIGHHPDGSARSGEISLNGHATTDKPNGRSSDRVCCAWFAVLELRA